jgi:hypothetical protein
VPFELSVATLNIHTAVNLYRLVDKYMPQPRLIKLNRINIDGNDASSDIVSIALAYFLNPPLPSLKYAIQFFLINIHQNLLQNSKTGPR